MKTKLIPVAVLIIFAGCSHPQYFLQEVDNPVFKPNVEFQGFEDLNHPGFQHLKEKYQLDTIFHGETEELKRILMLRHWIRSVIQIDDHGDPYPGEGYVEGILDAALQGQGFHCGHFMKVQNGIMNAYGYVTRTLGAGPGVKGGPDGHHGINEIWLNDYQKWFLSDAKYDHHFEKGGIPLSALEVRDAYLKNRTADITLVKGPDRIPGGRNPETVTSWERSARTYTWIEFHTHNDMFTAWPGHETMLSIYEDEYVENNTWIWDDKPHWAYDKPEFMRMVKDRDAIEWTPNTIASEIRIQGNVAMIRLRSETPNLKEYQVKEMPSGDWLRVDASFTVDLSQQRHEWHFRTMNLAGVPGPVHRIVISRNKIQKTMSTTALYEKGIYLIPYPQEVIFLGEDFNPVNEISIVLDRDASDNDLFVATELAVQLKKEWGIQAGITKALSAEAQSCKTPSAGVPSDKAIILTHQGVSERIRDLPEKKALQGLGHVSYILKWPRHSHLREMPASNWEFCPLKEGSYELLLDLWEDAIEATPGSGYIHIGSDETYELGKCKQCRLKSDEIGKSSF